MEIFSYLQGFNAASIFLRLMLAVVLGGLVGAERGTKHQAAGIRTFALVCLGAALAMITNDYLAVLSGKAVDSSRMAAQVISGIGFLGAGTIIVTGNNRVKGLTTAASLWAVATLGIAIGSGFWYGALLGFLFIIISIRVLDKCSKWLEANNRILDVYIEMEQEEGMKKIQCYMHNKKFQIRSIQRKHQKPLYKESICITLEIDLKGRCSHETVLYDIEQLKGIHYIEEIL